MPKTWNDKYIPSKADNTVDMLTNSEIGGVGKVEYPVYQFSKYILAPIKNSSSNYSYPIYNEDLPIKQIRMSGKEILVSLYNLAMRIDSFDVHESYEQQIINWCQEVCSPYGFEHFDDYIKKINNYSTANINSVLHMEFQFEINQFMKDLEDLYTATKFYFALNSNSDSNAYNLYSEGKHFEQLPFFENLKSSKLHLKKGASLDEYNKLSFREQVLYQDEFFESKPTEDGQFAIFPAEKYNILLNKLLSLVPEFKMKLVFNKSTEHPMLIARVNSVFDIAWYTFARMLSDDNTLPKIGTDEELKDGVVLYCAFCGQAFIRRNNRQKYCGSIQCERKRNSKNTNAFRAKHKVEANTPK